MYSSVLEYIDSIIKKFYSVIEEYLEYIFNSPSTINRIIRYYTLGYSPYKVNERYILFNGKVVKTFFIYVPKGDFNERSFFLSYL